MNAEEAGLLLMMMSELDNRELSASRAQAFAFVLDDIPFEFAKLAIKPAYKEAAATPNGYVDAGAIRRHAEPIMRRNARDVRSATARGWVPKDWPEARLLPTAVTTRLQAEFAANNDSPDDIAALSTGRPADLGVILRSTEEDQ